MMAILQCHYYKTILGHYTFINNKVWLFKDPLPLKVYKKPRVFQHKYKNQQFLKITQALKVVQVAKATHGGHIATKSYNGHESHKQKGFQDIR